MFYDEFRSILQDIATENGGVVHPTVGKAHGRRSIKVEGVSCPAAGHECAPSPEAMMDRLQELVGVEFVEMKEKVVWNKFRMKPVTVFPRLHPDKVEWTKLPHKIPTKTTLIKRTTLVSFLFQKGPPEEFTREFNVRKAHYQNIYRRLTGHLFDSNNPRHQQWVWTRAATFTVEWYIKTVMKPETKWLVQIVLSKELSRLEPYFSKRKERATERAPDAND